MYHFLPSDIINSCTLSYIHALNTHHITMTMTIDFSRFGLLVGLFSLLQKYIHSLDGVLSFEFLSDGRALLDGMDE